MKIAITGAGGLVGQALRASLTQRSDEVHLLKRPDDWYWGDQGDHANPQSLAGHDVVVHLAGENVGDRRWSAAKKQAIFDSRQRGTRIIAQTLTQLPQAERPKLLLCASAIGYYGNRGDEILTETSEAGQGFLPEVCIHWEQAADPARQAGIRVIHTRLSIVLAGHGGPLTSMLPFFKLCLGGVVGSGKQYWSWITLDDAVRAMIHCIDHPDLAGPINVTSPQPVTNREFTRTLAKQLGRPAFLPVPAMAARLALGEMADDLLLASVRAVPHVLQQSGFVFHHPTLMQALAHVLQPASRRA
jgi:uncharacterized protein (TIGR01777 family)